MLRDEMSCRCIVLDNNQHFHRFISLGYISVYNVQLKLPLMNAAGRWFSPCIPVSSTNKTERHELTEILLEVVLNIKP